MGTEKVKEKVGTEKLYLQISCETSRGIERDADGYWLIPLPIQGYVQTEDGRIPPGTSEYPMVEISISRNSRSRRMLRVEVQLK